MANIHFIKDEITNEIIQGLLEIAGSNFQAAFDTSVQPPDGTKLNKETLIQFDLPGGTSISGMQNPGAAINIGGAINSMVSAIAPFISAFGLILPILGVIKGIMEVICALMNPYKVKKAVKKLMKKWIPPFISLFPPIAGILILLNIIKTILAITFFIMTTVIPPIKLIIENIKSLATIAFNRPDATASQLKAITDKMAYMIAELLRQVGLLAVIEPILEIVTRILELTASFPCKKRKKEKGSGPLGLQIPAFTDTGVDDDDQACCDDESCPPEITEPASGSGVLTVSRGFGDRASGIFILMTNNEKIGKIKPYSVSLEDQLNAQLDEGIDRLAPPGSEESESVPFRIKLSGKRSSSTTRGTSGIVTANVLKIIDNNVLMSIPQSVGFPLLGRVNYEIIPDYDVLVMNGIIGIGCHPEITEARDAIEAISSLEDSVFDKFPAAVGFSGATNAFGQEVGRELGNVDAEIKTIQGYPMDDFRNLVQQVGPDRDDLRDATNDPALLDMINNFPDNNIANIDNSLNNILDLGNSFIDYLTGILSQVLSRAADRFNSLLEADKLLARSDAKDVVTIIVTPQDAGGARIAKNMPNNVDIESEIFSDFGILSNKRFDRVNGQILVDLISNISGTATITAKINNQYISDRNEDGAESSRKLSIKFISDDILPTRRNVSAGKK